MMYEYHLNESFEKKHFFLFNTLCCGIILTVKNANITSVRVCILNSILQVKETQRKNLYITTVCYINLC